MVNTAKYKLYYGYIVVIAALGISMVTWGTLNTYGIFYKPLLTEFGWTRAVTAGARALASGISGLLGIITGGLTDRFGPKRVLLLSGTLLGLGYLLLSRVSDTWQFYVIYGTFVSFGMSAATIPLQSTVARWFVKRRGFMTGFAQAGDGLGGMVLAPMIGWIILNRDWRSAYSFLGVLVLVLVFPLGLLLKRDPVQIGLLPYGAECSTKIDANIREINPHDVDLPLRKAIRTTQFRMLSIMLFAFGFCRTSMLVHIVAHVTDLGFSLAIGANVLAIIMGVSMITRIGMGRLADLRGNKHVFIIGFIVMGSGMFWMLLAEQLWMLYIFAIAFGFSWGTLAVVRVPMIADIFGLTSLGMISGTLDFSAQVGAFIGPLLGGQLFDLTGQYTGYFLVAASLATLGIILTTLLSPIYMRK